jgi:hypothetical protein
MSKSQRPIESIDAQAITPAMIKAGEAELLDYQPGYSFPAETIRRIWVAMMEAPD